jgi:DNA-binding NarL/FixJ family response regulator
MESIAVAVVGSDALSVEGAVARLGSYPGLVARAWDGVHRTDVLLVLAEDVDEQLVERVEDLSRRTRGGERPAVVLVAGQFPEQFLLRAVNFGLVSLVCRREATFDRLVAIIRQTAQGHPHLPHTVQRSLLGQLRAIQENVLAPRGLNATGLTEREITLLRFFADGLSTREVALKLNYSERTVKNVVHDIVTRFGLGNRTHAVAYALRAGAL